MLPIIPPLKAEDLSEEEFYALGENALRYPSVFRVRLLTWIRETFGKTRSSGVRDVTEKAR